MSGKGVKTFAKNIEKPSVFPRLKRRAGEGALDGSRLPTAMQSLPWLQATASHL